MAQLYYFKGRGRAETTRWMLAANGIDFQNIPIETPQALAALRSDDWMNEIYPLWIGAHGVMITLRRMARPSTRRRYAPWTKLKRKNYFILLRSEPSALAVSRFLRDHEADPRSGTKTYDPFYA
jgi:hypothetical protein